MITTEIPLKTVNDSSDNLSNSSKNSVYDHTFINHIPKRSESVSSILGPRLPPIRRARMGSSPPDSDKKLNKSNDSRSHLSPRIQSTGSLSPRLLGPRFTSDSGTGISMTNLPNQASSANFFDDQMAIYGLEETASMPNRLDYDLSKVIAHKLRLNVKHTDEPSSPTGLYNSRPKKPIGTFLSSILSSKKPSTASISPPATPLVRHHNSEFYLDKNGY